MQKLTGPKSLNYGTAEVAEPRTKTRSRERRYMDRRFLEGLGLEKDVIDKVLDQNGTEITALKTQLTTKDTEIKTLRADLITANNRVGELEKVNVEDLERQLTEEREGRAKDKKEFELRALLSKEGCTDTDYLLYKLGDGVEFDDKGKVKDPENFMRSVKEQYAGQFQEAQAGGTGKPSNFPRNRTEITPPEKNPYTEKGWNLTEQMRIEVTDPEKAKLLKAEANVG